MRNVHEITQIVCILREKKVLATREIPLRNNVLKSYINLQVITLRI